MHFHFIIPSYLFTNLLESIEERTKWYYVLMDQNNDCIYTYNKIVIINMAVDKNEVTSKLKNM